MPQTSPFATHTTVSASIATTPSLVVSHRSEHGLNESLALKPGDLDWDSVESRFRRLGATLETSHEERVVLVAEVLSQLRHQPLLSKLLSEYFPASQAIFLPGPLALPAVSSFETTIASYQLFDGTEGEQTRLIRLAEKVLRSTEIVPEITESMTPEEFVAMHIGENLRLEYIGLVYSIAARACLLGMTRDDQQHDKTVKDLFRSSTVCLRLARELTPVNDAMTWLAQDNVTLTTSLQGDSSELKRILCCFYG